VGRINVAQQPVRRMKRLDITVAEVQAGIITACSAITLACTPSLPLHLAFA
jgi:hypothetical protein